MKNFESTIELIKLQRAALIDVIQWLDEKNFSNTKIRSKVDIVLNHNKDMDKTSNMELTKIKFISPNYAYVKKGS